MNEENVVETVEEVETESVIDNDGKEIKLGKNDSLAVLAGVALCAFVGGIAGKIGSKVVDKTCEGFEALKEKIEEKKEEAKEKKAEKKAKKAKEED